MEDSLLFTTSNGLILDSNVIAEGNINNLSASLNGRHLVFYVNETPYLYDLDQGSLLTLTHFDHMVISPFVSSR